MDDRLATSTPANSPSAFSTQVELPEPPRAEPNRLEFLRGVHSDYARVPHRAPANTAAATTNAWSRATSARG
jgi:hypothetical protein